MKDKSVKEIKAIIENLNQDQYEKYIDILNQDSRKSVQNLAKGLGKKLEKIKKEEERLELINTFENEGYKNGYVYIGGVDEAGRGPLAGPVVASVVVFEKDTKIPYVNDSKKLSEAKRDELFEVIKEQALD
ncbi:MAG: ribonuclease HII, partial [Intestinibacter sp.]